MISFFLTSEKKDELESSRIDQCLFRLAEDDNSAMEELYHQTSTSVYSFALSILKNPHDAEDVLHDCYVRIYSAAKAYRSHGKPLAWILTITKNLCFQKLKQHQKAVAVSPEEWESYFQTNPAMTPEDTLLVTECLKTLSDAERQILILHAVSGFKHREVAALLSLPLSTVLSKYNRALKKLRHLCERE